MAARIEHLQKVTKAFLFGKILGLVNTRHYTLIFSEKKEAQKYNYLH